MPYEFITYQIEEGRKSKTFDMFHIKRQGEAAYAVKKVIGQSLIDSVFGAHALFDVKPLKDSNIIIPSDIQKFCDPVTIGNKAFIGMIKMLNSGQTIIMNSNGGHQTYKPELLTEMGWKEISREEREELSFKKYK